MLRPFMSFALDWLALTVVAPARAADPVVSPSFACAQVTWPVEKAICDNPDLAAKDRRIADFYALTRPAAVGPGRSAQLDAQRKWLKVRNDCLGGPLKPLARCIGAKEDSRLFDLAVSSLFRDPPAALSALDLVAPRTAKIYHALYLYATAADPAERARRAAPLVAELIKEPDFDSAAGGLLTTKAADGAARPLRADEIIASDATFGLFLNVAATSAWREGDYTLAIPCDAFLRRPGLLDALGSVYGSTLDSQAAQSDCPVMQPLPAALDSLLDQARDEVVAPSAGCTIRFAYDREADHLLTHIRLMRPLGKAQRWTGEDGGALAAHFLRTHGAGRTLAATALAHYYEITFGAAAPAARDAADAAVTDAVLAIFAGSC
jgi:hypothetical protein